MARWLMMTLLLAGPVNADALQDPTRPPGQQAAPPTAVATKSFTLSSILYGQDRRVAVIDGVPRSEGDTFNGVRLRRIYPGRVELVVNGQVRVVRLSAPPVIRTSK